MSAPNRPSVLDVLDMGIWSDDGTVWLPKELYPKRTEAKMFAVEHLSHSYIDVRVRSRWMRCEPNPEIEDMPYEVSSPDAEGAFECWEIT